MEIKVTTFPMSDTGLGIEAGYESDAAMIAEVEAERAAMDPPLLEAIKDYERRMMRDFLFGFGKGD